MRALYLCVGFGLIFGSVKMSSALTGKNLTCHKTFWQAFTFMHCTYSRDKQNY